jgi:hypothetical protein
MSVKALSWVWEHSPHDGGNLLVLLALADFADADGLCWPSHAKLAAKSRLSERQVERALKELVASGDLDAPSGPRSQSNPYRVRQNVVPTPTSGTPDSDGPALSGPYVEPSRTAKKPSRRDLEIDEVWAHYQIVFPKKRVKLDPKLKRIISKALDVRELEICKEAVSGLAADRWCMGHEPRPFDGIGYALSAIGKESIEERIDRMASQAGERIPGQPDSRSGLINVHEFAQTLPSASRETFWIHVRNVVKWHEDPEHPIYNAQGRDSSIHLAQVRRVEVKFEDGKAIGLYRLKENE